MVTAGSRSVASQDGVRIAYWSSGDGPPLLLVHGAMSDHRRWRIVPQLAEHRTVHAMDRRGRGGSGDGPEWSLDREVDDVVTLVEALADEAGHPVDLLGHSLGGLLALRAAARTGAVHRLVLYEPAVDEPAQDAQLLDRMRALLDAGRPDDVVVLMMREVVLMPAHEIEAMQAMPTWHTRVEAAPTLPRELATDLVADPTEVAAVTAPTLVMRGSDSPAPVRDACTRLAAALPSATTVAISGQQHVADQLVPDLFARLVLDFLEP